MIPDLYDGKYLNLYRKIDEDYDFEMNKLKNKIDGNNFSQTIDTSNVKKISNSNKGNKFNKTTYN